jgi:hypothetical protein
VDDGALEAPRRGGGPLPPRAQHLRDRRCTVGSATAVEPSVRARPLRSASSCPFGGGLALLLGRQSGRVASGARVSSVCKPAAFGLHRPQRTGVPALPHKGKAPALDHHSLAPRHNRASVFARLLLTGGSTEVSRAAGRAAGCTNDGQGLSGRWRVGALLLRPGRAREQEPGDFARAATIRERAQFALPPTPGARVHANGVGS